MRMPQLSIIIATFNADKTLERALQSVISLKYKDWECILIDGASQDNTVGIIQKFASNDPRIKYISEPDKGIYDAFNKGWKMAKGEWIYYLGADDQLMPDAFIKCMSHSEGHDVLYGYTLHHSRHGLKRGNFNPDVNYLRIGMICNHQALMMRRCVIEKLKGFDLRYKIIADSDLVQRAYLDGCSFCQVDEPIAIFNGGGVSSSFRTIKESFLKRKRNHSVGIFENIYHTWKHFIGKIKSTISLFVLNKLVNNKL